MKLYGIAMRSLGRRKGKMAFMLLGLILSAAVVISIYSIVRAMQSDIRRQLAELGSNIVITPHTGELTFQYGGITIPELIFDVEKLTVADLEAVRSIPGARAIVAAAPKLVGTISHKHHNLVIAGVDLPAEFAVKPWLRFYEGKGGMEEKNAGKETGAGHAEEMDYRPLDLRRAEEVPDLARDQVILGFNTAALLDEKEGSALELGGKTYTVLAVLAETGAAGDDQVFMSLAEAQVLLDRPGELTVIEIASDFDLLPGETLLSQLREALPHARVTGVRQAVMGRHELLSALTRFGLFATVMVFISGTLVVVLTMSAAVRERTREIGILRSIGFRGTHIFTVIIWEGVLVSAAGGVIGYHAGLWASRLAGPAISGAALNASWEPAALALTIIATAAAGGVACIFPALTAARLDPADALRFY